MESEYGLEQPKSFLCRVKRDLMPAPGGSQAGVEDTSEKCQDKGDGRPEEWPSLKPREVWKASWRRKYWWKALKDKEALLKQIGWGKAVQTKSLSKGPETKPRGCLNPGCAIP